MGIQDRDYYWKDRYQGESTAASADNSGHPPGNVNSDFGRDEVPRRNVIWAFLCRPWVAPFIWGTVVGRSWESLKLLGQAVFDRFIGVLF